MSDTARREEMGLIGQYHRKYSVDHFRLIVVVGIAGN